METEKIIDKPWLFQKGQSGNPGGKPKGARNKLQGDFLGRLADDFNRYGIWAIARTRRHRPWEYVKIVASLMPKELEVSKGLNELSDEQLNAALIAARAILASADIGERDQDEEGEESAKRLQTLSETD